MAEPGAELGVEEEPNPPGVGVVNDGHPDVVADVVVG